MSLKEISKKMVKQVLDKHYADDYVFTKEEVIELCSEIILGSAEGILKSMNKLKGGKE